MEKIDEIKNELVNAILNDKYKGDLSDLGNIIGIVVGKYLNENEMGFEKDNFLAGLRHGFSLADGTH